MPKTPFDSRLVSQKRINRYAKQVDKAFSAMKRNARNVKRFQEKLESIDDTAGLLGNARKRMLAFRKNSLERQNFLLNETMEEAIKKTSQLETHNTRIVKSRKNSNIKTGD